MAEHQSRANHVEIGNIKAQSKENFNRITRLEQFLTGIPEEAEGKEGSWLQAENFITKLLLIIWVWIMIGLEYKELTGPLNAK